MESLVCGGVSNIGPHSSGWSLYHNVGIDCERGAGTRAAFIGVAGYVSSCNFVCCNDRCWDVATAEMHKYRDVLAVNKFDMSE